MKIKTQNKIKARSNAQAVMLIELVITISLMMIIFPVTGLFVGKSLLSYDHIVTRTKLVDSAEIAIRRMERDIHSALPNSIRVKTENGRVAIEMVNTVEALRYRAQTPGGKNEVLTFNEFDTQFNVLDTFKVAQLGNKNYRIAIYNLGANGFDSDDPIPGSNVYSSKTGEGPNPPFGSHVITPATTEVTLSNVGAEGHIKLNKPFQFAFRSPMQRAYIIDTPISYVYDPVVGTLTQYKNYPIWAQQSTSPTTYPLTSATSALLSKEVVDCNFDYQIGLSQRKGLVTIKLTVGKGTEKVTLLHQVNISNAP